MSEKLTGRSVGWTNAKQRGHQNERDVASILKSDPGEALRLRRRLMLPALTVVQCGARTGGSDQESVPSVMTKPALTKGKVDLEVWWVGEPTTTRMSLKGSLKGQVDLRPVSFFLNGMKAQFGSHYSKNVQLGLNLFVGDPGLDIGPFMRGRRYLGPVSKDGISIEKSQGRLAPATLRRYFKDEWSEVLEWLDLNRDLIAEFVFSRGLARDPANHAQFVWYRTFSSASVTVDKIYRVSDIVQMCRADQYYVRNGNVNCGTTIDLPFGFLQRHQSKLQFHHDHSKLVASGLTGL